MSGVVRFPWKTNVMGIMGDCRVLCASILCPALAYYATSEQFEHPPALVFESCIGGYCICYGFILRTRLRNKYNLDGSTVGDLLAHLCCHCVALARIWREAEMQAEALKQQQNATRPNPNVIQMTPQPAQAVQPSIQQQQQQQQPFALQTSGPPVIMQPGIVESDMSISSDHMALGTQQMTYFGPYGPQTVFVPTQPMVMPHMAGVAGQWGDLQNTVDTNLSDFESKKEVNEGNDEMSSYKRIDSLDPPPSNTDPDPWDMIPGPLRRRRTPQDLMEAVRQTTLVGPQAQKMPAEPQDTAGKSYAEFVAAELCDSASPEQQVTPIPVNKRVPSAGSSEGRRTILSQRLAELRPSNVRPSALAYQPELSDESAVKLAKNDTSELVDQVILSGSNLVTILGGSREEPTYRPLEEDPPQQPLDRTGSLPSRHDDASCVTRGATVGTTEHTGLETISTELLPSRETSKDVSEPYKEDR